MTQNGPQASWPLNRNLKSQNPSSPCLGPMPSAEGRCKAPGYDSAGGAGREGGGGVLGSVERGSERVRPASCTGHGDMEPNRAPRRPRQRRHSRASLTSNSSRAQFFQPPAGKPHRATKGNGDTPGGRPPSRDRQTDHVCCAWFHTPLSLQTTMTLNTAVEWWR